jgi:hypothetical protein
MAIIEDAAAAIDATIESNTSFFIDPLLAKKVSGATSTCDEYGFRVGAWALSDG